MAVQMATAQASYFMANIDASAGVPAAGAVTATADNAGIPAQESFNRILAAAKLAKSMYVEKHGMDEASGIAAEIEKFAEGLSDEDLAMLAAPISAGADLIRDFADALDAELMEGDVRGAVELAGMAVEKAGKFDPDLILGGDFMNGSLHRLIEEFLNKFRLSQGEKAGPGTPDAPKPPAELPKAGAELPQGKEELPREGDEAADPSLPAAPETPAEKTPDMPEDAEKTEEMPKHPDVPVLSDLPEDDSKKDAGDEDKKGQNGTRDKKNDDERDPDASVPVRDRSAMTSGFAEAIKTEESTRGTDLDQAAKPQVPVKADESGETAAKKPGPASVSKEQKIERRAYGVKPEDDAELKNGAFSGEFASAMRARPGTAKAENAAQTPMMTLPGSTYSLNAESPLGDGMRSVLEFMRNDGINEARIVVEPPSLGRVDVSLQASGAGVEAVFKVDNESLKQILQQQLDILKTSLEQQGIHVSNLAVDIKNRDDQKGRPDPYGGRAKARRADGIADADGENEPRLARIDLEKGLLHWVA